jgi:hypothetical protein
MHVKGLAWLGTKTRNYGAMRSFLRDVMGLRIHLEQPDFTDFELPNGDTIELFGPR